MKLLVDANLSHKVAAGLRAAGHEARHLQEIGMQTSSDPAVLAVARDEERVLVTADADFGRLLALGGLTRPSVVLLRPAPRRNVEVLRLLVSLLPLVDPALSEGSLVVVEPSRIRVRKLPIRG